MRSRIDPPNKISTIAVKRPSRHPPAFRLRATRILSVDGRSGVASPPVPLGELGGGLGGEFGGALIGGKVVNGGVSVEANGVKRRIGEGVSVLPCTIAESCASWIGTGIVKAARIFAFSDGTIASSALISSSAVW